MNKSIRLKNFGTVLLEYGLPDMYSSYLVPSAKSYHAVGEWGIICLQELTTSQFSFKHLLFHLNKQVSIYCGAQKQKIQSLICLDGNFQHKIQGLKSVDVGEKEFLLFSNNDAETLLTAYPTKRSTIVFTEYNEKSYQDYISLFKSFKKDIKRSVSGAFYFTSSPKVARHSIHDAINAIWAEQYAPNLIAKHIELKLSNSLFTQLAQTYQPIPKAFFTPSEKTKAEEARAFILKNITIHHLPEQVAAELFCSAPWLKKAFSKVYGVGLFQYLRKTRMMMAREMLLRGESLKVVALSVGMKPQNFPKEFKSFFGYTVTDLKQGEL